MNLITCKKFKGGGNSLKFRGKSEEVRVGRAASLFAAVGDGSCESGKREEIFSFFNLHSSLSFLLSVALVFGVSGARATVFLSESRALEDNWTLNDTLAIAYDTSASETIVLDVGSWYLTVKGNLIVGHNRKGELNLGTGNVSVIPASNNVGTYIGNDSAATGVVNIDGGTFIAGGAKPFYIGQYGRGILNLNSGSVVSTNDVYIGNNATGNGTVNVNGGTFEARKILTVGNSGTGAMTIGDGGTVTVTDKLTVGTSSGRGTLTVDGGILTFGYNYNTQSTVDNGMFLIEKGSVTLNGNGHLVLGRNTNSPGTMTVKSGGSYTGTGNNLGLIVGWESLGTLNIEGGTVTLKNLTFCIDSGALAAK